MMAGVIYLFRESEVLPRGHSPHDCGYRQARARRKTAPSVSASAWRPMLRLVCLRSFCRTFFSGSHANLQAPALQSRTVHSGPSDHCECLVIVIYLTLKTRL